MKFIQAFRHLFIPHEGNDYKPHFFRELSIVILLFGSIFLLGFSAGSSFLIHKTVLGASVAANVLVDLTNDARLAYNESPLVINDKLQEAAALKGQDMAKFGYFAHESPTGVTPWYWFKQAGYTFLYAGENLAINFTQSNDVESAWLASPKHRENILNVRFTEIGIATVDGVYNNTPTTYVVQMFGTPAKLALSPVATTTVIATSTAVKEKETPKTNLAVLPSSGNVKGEATGTDVVSKERSNLVPVYNTPTLAVVQNTDNVTEVPPEKSEARVEYSTWLGRLLFSGSSYVDTIYKILILIIALALLTMIFVEIRRQHYKHILYGVLLLMILAVFVYLNHAFIY
jgi:hypothetical protein